MILMMSHPRKRKSLTRRKTSLTLRMTELLQLNRDGYWLWSSSNWMRQLDKAWLVHAMLTTLHWKKNKRMSWSTNWMYRSENKNKSIALRHKENQHYRYLITTTVKMKKARLTSPPLIMAAATSWNLISSLNAWMKTLVKWVTFSAQKPLLNVYLREAQLTINSPPIALTHKKLAAHWSLEA